MHVGLSVQSLLLILNKREDLAASFLAIKYATHYLLQELFRISIKTDCLDGHQLVRQLSHPTLNYDTGHAVGAFSGGLKNLTVCKRLTSDFQSEKSIIWISC
jgi:hypothetical protein